MRLGQACLEKEGGPPARPPTHTLTHGAPHTLGCHGRAAGATVVVEEFLTGEEASFFAFIDGENCVPLVGAQVSWRGRGARARHLPWHGPW